MSGSTLSGLGLSLGQAQEPDEELEPVLPGERDWDAEARVLGWKPLPADPEHPQKHEFQGDPAKWTDSRTFVLRGEQNMPVMREQIRRLSEKNRRQEQQLDQMRQQQEESARKIDDLLDLAKNAQARGYKQARAELEAQKREAIQNGDVATVDKIEAGMREIDADAAKLAKVGAKPAEPAAPSGQPRLDPAIDTFARENASWWNKDNFLTQQMIAEHLVVMRKHPAMSTADQLDKALTALKEKFPAEFGITPQPKPPASRPAQDPVEDDVDDEPILAPRRQAPTVAAPRAVIEGGPRSRSAFERIPQEDRAEAKREFARFQNHDPGLTEGEFVELFLNPGADVLAVQRKYRGQK
jgi:hypothetical protein